MKTFLPVVCVLLASIAAACGSNGGSTTSNGGTMAGTTAAGGTTANGGATSNGGASSQPLFGDRYKFADNEINGWTQDPASDALWVGTDLIAGTSIDGAAEAYYNEGFVQGMFQTLDGPDSQTCTIRAMDFGTATKATSMYGVALANFVSQATAIPTYDSSAATGTAAISGLTVYAHFGATYFEVFLSGLGDQRSTCTQCPLAQQFLDKLKAKSN